MAQRIGWLCVGTGREGRVPNPRFNLMTLRVFAAAAELRSISKAATRENIAVSAASKRISDLESDIGTPLLSRLSRGVELTPAGAALLHHATSIFRSLDQLEIDLGEYALGVKGHVRIAVNKSSVLAFLPEDLSAFVKEYPDLKIDLREEQSPKVVRAVVEGLVDVGVFTTAGLAVPSGLQLYLYRRSRIAIIAPQGHALACRPQVSLADALDYDFVVDTGTAWDMLLAEASARLGRSLRLRFRVTSLDAVCRLISQGLAIGLAPPAVLQAFASAASLVAIPLNEPWAERDLMICVRDMTALPLPAKLMVRHLTRCGREAGLG